MIDLGPFLEQEGVDGQANGLNDAGLVVGTYKQAGRGSVGFVFGANKRTLISEAASSRARAINVSGEAVGDFDTGSSESSSHAFAWPSGGTISEISVAGGRFELAAAVNDLGQVAGSFESAGSSVHHAAIYSGGTVIDLGTLGGMNSDSSAINSVGQVVGSSQLSAGSRHAFLYSDSKMLDLGTLGGLESRANGINARGQVVGWATTTAGQQHAVLWRSAEIFDLNAVVALGDDAVLQEATAVNDAGQIVVNGSNGHAYLITLPAEHR
jgi:probable HAF family extracellular repeat protein